MYKWLERGDGSMHMLMVVYACGLSETICAWRFEAETAQAVEAQSDAWAQLHVQRCRVCQYFEEQPVPA